MILFSSRVIKTKGQAAAVLNLFLAVFVIAALGAFSVELSRYLLAQDQLKSSVEAAALCCQTILVSSGNSTSATNQTSAETAALSLFQQNSILGQNLSSASLVAIASGQTVPQFDVGPGESQICFQFLDPITRQPINSSSTTQSVSNTSSSTTGTVIQATAAYSYTPFFGQFIGLGNTQFTFQTSAVSGIPQLDLVFVYDISGAENTQTSTTYLQRYWDTPYGIDYLLPSPIGDPPTTGITGGPLAPFCRTNAPNQGPNPTTPQNLDNSQNCPSPQIKYAELAGSATQQLTGAQAYAAPPGNYPYNGTIYLFPAGYQAGGAALPGWNRIFFAPVVNTSPSMIITAQLSDYVAVPYGVINPPFANVGFWLMPPMGGAPGTGTFDKVIYVAKNSGFPFSSLSPQLSAYQTPYLLNNGPNTDGQVTVTLGGGSAFSAAALATPPTGPTVAFNQSDFKSDYFMQAAMAVPAAPSSSNSTVASVLAGNTYNNYGHVYTDAVVNIDGNTTFQNTTVTYNGDTYPFPSLGAVVEASRGNLESAANAQAAGINLQALGLTSIQSGYYAAYMQAAMAAIQPMNTVANATIAFMNQLATVSNADFGYLAFNDYSGTSATSSVPSSGTDPDNIATAYPYPSINTNPDGTIGYSTTDAYLMPNIAVGSGNQSTIANVLPTIHTWGNCNVAGALNAALTELAPQVVGSTTASPARPAANKAIILITSQAPNLGLNGDTGASAVSDAVAQAQLANQAGIPIFCVSIAQSSSDDTNEDAAYNQLATTAGHGSKYYRIDWSNPTTTQSALTSAFANIARQLICVVH